jgi:hypothetical protein
VADIKVAGNVELPSSQLMPHITIEKKRSFCSRKFSDQLVLDSVKNLKAVYESIGFSDVAVAPTVTNRGGDINVAFRVTEGPRDMVSSLTVEGADTFPAARYAPNGLKLAVGQPYSQAHVQQDRANVVANYLRAGYLTSSFRKTATEVSKKDSHQINVVYHIYEGPRVITGDVITLGREHTAQQLINRDVAMLKPEQPLTETDLLTAGSRLYDLPNVFDWAEVDPRREVTTQTTEDVLVKVHEAKNNDYTYGIGFEVVNGGGHVPGGTNGVPGHPRSGCLEFHHQPNHVLGPRGQLNTHATISAEGGNPFPLLVSREYWTSGARSITSILTSAHPVGALPSRLPPKITSRIPSTRQCRKLAAFRCNASSTGQRRTHSFFVTSSARPI